MGVLCSTVDKEGREPLEGKAQDQAQLHSHIPRRLHKMPQSGPPVRSSKTLRPSINDLQFSTEAEYHAARAALIQAEKATAFDAEVIATASDIEKKANDIVRGIRNYDWDKTYSLPPSSKRVCSKTGNILVENTAGQHFLTNVDLINKTELFKVARKMPKGAHLHVHFNSCLPPKFLIRQARGIPDTMWICSSRPLVNDAEFRNCRIQFNVFNATGVAAANKKLDKDQKISVESQPTETNIFKSNYRPMRWMKYQDFVQQFDWTDDQDESKRRYHGIDGVEDWLEKKMVFSDEEAHGVHQTSRGYGMLPALTSVLTAPPAYGRDSISALR
jgi:adenosine deaminase CECR1